MKNKEFYEICGINATNKDFEDNGFKVINFSMVKNEYLKIIKNKDVANRFHLYNNISDNDTELNEIYNQFDKIVFKESRSGGGYTAIGWENINSYLSYHSGIHYKWFKDN